MTGASGALAGKAAQYLAENGAKVAFISRNQSKLDLAVKDLGPEAAWMPARSESALVSPPFSEKL